LQPLNESGYSIVQFGAPDVTALQRKGKGEKRQLFVQIEKR